MGHFIFLIGIFIPFFIMLRNENKESWNKIWKVYYGMPKNIRIWFVFFYFFVYSFGIFLEWTKKWRSPTI